jgi:hypothetical protein
MTASRRKHSPAKAATITPASLAEPFTAFVTAAHAALVSDGSIAAADLAKAEQALAGISPELAAVAVEAHLAVHDKIARQVADLGSGGDPAGVRRGGSAELATVVSAVAAALINPASVNSVTARQTCLTEAETAMEAARRELRAAVEGADTDMALRARTVLELTGPGRVETARINLADAERAVADERLHITEELNHPLVTAEQVTQDARDQIRAAYEAAESEHAAAVRTAMIGADAVAEAIRLAREAGDRVAEVRAEAERGRRERFERMAGEAS